MTRRKDPEPTEIPGGGGDSPAPEPCFQGPGRKAESITESPQACISFRILQDPSGQPSKIRWEPTPHHLCEVVQDLPDPGRGNRGIFQDSPETKGGAIAGRWSEIDRIPRPSRDSRAGVAEGEDREP